METLRGPGGGRVGEDTYVDSINVFVVYSVYDAML